MKSLIADNISKAYEGRRYIFEKINLSLNDGDSVALTGRNGSGKTTLLKVLAGLLQASRGTCHLNKNNTQFNELGRLLHLGYVAPYLNLYEEFSPIELLRLHSKMKGFEYNTAFVDSLLEKYSLTAKRNSPVKTYSSGMKQRVRFILAFANPNLDFLFLDEPFTNLDKAGIEVTIGLIRNFMQSSGILLIATNEDKEKQLCGKILELNN